MKVVLEVALVLAAGAAVGLGLHAVRDDGVRWGEVPRTEGVAVCGAPTGAPAEQHAGPRWIGADDALGMLSEPGVVFVDARPRAEFEQGHVAGAVNLPEDGPRSAAAMDLLRGARTVVTYCDGSDACECSTVLADELAASGIRDVRVLEGGVASWLARGLPGEAGTCRLCTD
ncbi:MAG: rhodanese-like domain-containing protein [Deltaproteobacteria bacterium]|nr:rhodanese-like domain-containing protein [Deltaproteobacteria bacterium]